MADQFARIAQSVTAMQWAGGEEAMREVEVFTQPSIVRYQPDGNLIISVQEGTLTLKPKDWIIEDPNGVLSTMTHQQFTATYTPLTSSTA